MSKERAPSQCRNFLLAGIALINLAYLALDASGRQSGNFFKIAMLASWGKPLDLVAAWCSCKIILLSLGLFLVIECLGTLLVLSNRNYLAWIVYALHVLPSLGFLMGGYYLIKALL